MEKINSEMFISSLFVLGFDRIDDLFFDFTMTQLLKDNAELKLFSLNEDCEISDIFENFVEFNGSIFKFKNGYTLDTMVYLDDDTCLPLCDLLKTNDVLINYLSDLDYKSIVLKKVKTMGVDKIETNIESFSFKEREIIKELFDTYKLKK